jgi:hypothetical protein
VAAALLDFCWSATQPASRSEMAGNCCPADMNRTGFQYVLEKHSEGDRAPDCQEDYVSGAHAEMSSNCLNIVISAIRNKHRPS